MTKAEKEARKAWLASLKVGDEVALMAMERGKVWDGARPTKRTIEGLQWGISLRADPRERSGCRLDSDGFSRADRYSGATGIFPITDAISTMWKADECRQRLHAAFEHPYRSATVTDDQAIRMCAILDEGKAAP